MEGLKFFIIFVTLAVFLLVTSQWMGDGIINLRDIEACFSDEGRCMREVGP